MKTFKVFFYVGMLSVLLLSFTQLSQPSPNVPYPEGFRDWKHIKTSVMGPNNPAFKQRGGFIHIYANDKAVEGYKTNRFADGSILVFEVLEAIDKNSDLSEGKRRFVDVMVRNRELYTNSGGWGFEEFTEDNKTEGALKELAIPKCFNCHAKKKGSDFVFSTMKE